MVKHTLPFVNAVIVADDGSSDDTRRIAETAGAFVIHSDHNQGTGEALRALFTYARNLDYDIIVTMDGDGQHDPSEIPLFLEAIAQGWDVVNGRRLQESIPKYRQVGNAVLTKISGLDQMDTQSGFRAYSSRAIQLLDPVEKGFGVDTELLVKAFDAGLRITEVPITVTYDVPHPSKKHPLDHMTDVVFNIIKRRSLKHPMLYYGLPGFISGLVGLGFLTWTAEAYATQHVFYTNLALIGGVAWISGLVIGSIGMIVWLVGTQVRER